MPAGIACRLLLACAAALTIASHTGRAQAPAAPIDLAGQFAAGKLRAVNREVTAVQGNPKAVHISEKEGPGVVWIDAPDFAQGTIEVDVRGRDMQGQSFVGIAFHGTDDHTYEGVYLRPFNFRATDPDRHQHAVQYISLPDYDWPRLRKEFPEEFENPVDQALEPTGWVPLRVVVSAKTIQIYAGPGSAPALEARRLGTLEHGKIGLWVGNNSDGDFANLRITPGR